MGFRTTLGTATCLTIIALSFTIGCQPSSGVVAEPAKRGQTATGTGAPVGDPGTSTDPAVNPTPNGTGAETVPATTASGDTPAATTPTPAAGGDSVADASGPVTLRFVLEEGLELKYKSTSESESKFAGTSAKMPEMKPVTTTSETVVKVLDNQGGKAKVEMTVGKMNMAGGMTDPNTQKQMQKMAKESAGVKVSAMFDPTGKPTDLKYEKGDRMQAMAAGLDSDTGFFGISYPEKAVKPGDTWTHDFDFKNAIGAFGPMANATWKDSMIVTKFTLKSVDPANGTAVIAISASGTPSMTMKMGAPPKDGDKSKVPNEMKMTFKVNGSGTATVELKNGLPKEVSYQMSTEFSNPMGGGTMTQRTKANLKRQ